MQAPIPQSESTRPKRTTLKTEKTKTKNNVPVQGKRQGSSLILSGGLSVWYIQALKEETQSPEEELCTLLDLPKQALTPSKNNFLDTPTIMIDQICVYSVTQSSWYIELAITARDSRAKRCSTICGLLYDWCLRIQHHPASGIFSLSFWREEGRIHHDVNALPSNVSDSCRISGDTGGCRGAEHMSCPEMEVSESSAAKPCIAISQDHQG